MGCDLPQDIVAVGFSHDRRQLFFFRYLTLADEAVQRTLEVLLRFLSTGLGNCQLRGQGLDLQCLVVQVTLHCLDSLHVHVVRVPLAFIVGLHPDPRLQVLLQAGLSNKILIPAFVLFFFRRELLL